MNSANNKTLVDTRCERLLLVLIVWIALCPTLHAKNKRHQGQVIGYFTESGAASGKYPVKNIVTSGAAGMLTQLDYAFGRVVDEQCQIANRDVALEHEYDAASSVDGSADQPGPNQLRGTFHQLQELKHLYPNLKILISFGGWGQSEGFTSAAEPDHVRDFVRSCVQTFIAGHYAPGIDEPGIFDGIDIDWEYPVEGGIHQGRPGDKAGFTTLAAEFRRQLDELRPGYLLTAALPAEEEYYKNFELKEISRYLDYISIMAYDLHWNSEPTTNFHSALFHDPADPSTAPLDKRYGDYALHGFLRAHVPAKKIVFGVPFYGKGWQGVKEANHGLYQTAAAPAGPGGSYRELKDLPPEADRKYFARAVACSVLMNSVFWSYDCPQALHKKMAYIRHHHLGGVMFWELSQDSPNVELLRILSGRE
ncbi:MAG TPA: glycoside hydrolase family 18 protein [Candidatus Dormibacteraeota bacterium]|jgi:chitinase|nr:glycoside hydrolase family 18 protein [Candidatus Dormibacteraeota bacterium]